MREDRKPKQIPEARSEGKEEEEDLRQNRRLHGTNHGKKGNSTRSEENGKGQVQDQKMAAHTRRLKGKEGEKKNLRVSQFIELVLI